MKHKVRRATSGRTYNHKLNAKLARAIKHEENIFSIKSLLENGANPNCADAGLICNVASSGNNEVLKMLLAYGGDAIPYGCCHLPLREAIANGHRDVILTLIDWYLDHHMESELYSHLEIIQWLKNNYEFVYRAYLLNAFKKAASMRADWPDTDWASLPLFLCSAGIKEAIQSFDLSSKIRQYYLGIDSIGTGTLGSWCTREVIGKLIDLVSRKGVIGGYSKFEFLENIQMKISTLLEQGVDINVKLLGGYTPLMYVVLGRHLSGDNDFPGKEMFTRFLLLNGADPRIKDDNGLTALDHFKSIAGEDHPATRLLEMAIEKINLQMIEGEDHQVSDFERTPHFGNSEAYFEGISKVRSLKPEKIHSSRLFSADMNSYLASTQRIISMREAFFALDIKNYPTNFCCSSTGQIMNIPVKLGEQYYNLQTLLDLPVIDSQRYHPFTNQPFSLDKIEPAGNIRRDIDEFIYMKVDRLMQANPNVNVAGELSPDSEIPSMRNY